MPTFENQRAFMVERHLKRRDISDPLVLEAMGRVEREHFIPKDMRPYSYEDRPLPIAEGQTISQPYIVAAMTQALKLKGGEKALEIGTGSGYAAAVLAEIAGHVYTIERHETLAKNAKVALKAAGYSNVTVICGDGTKGYEKEAPFDCIVATAAGPKVPETLKKQLKIGGHLVIPVGQQGNFQRLLRITRTGENDFESEDLGGVAFVPLIGEEGF